MHRRFSEAVNAEFRFVDFRMRWQDRDKSILYRIVSWFVCAFTFKGKRDFDILLVDNLHFYPVIMKMLGLIRKKQKIVAHMGSHTLYFMYAHRFSKFTEWMHVQALKRYDIVICEGKMAEYLTKQILPVKTPKLYTIFNGIPEEHVPEEKYYTQNLNGKNILFMGHGPGENRLWYKGLDLMIASFDLAFKKDTELTFTIAGHWDDTVIAELLSSYDPVTKNAIKFVGQTSQLGQYTKDASLYLHCARGEAFGITILIAMAAGIPSLVSEWTGGKEVVEQVDNRFVVGLEKEKIAEKILWYFSLSPDEKKIISEKSMVVARTYTATKAVDFYKQTFLQIEKDFGF
jgi:glycosyltransferase involved in cell wall biosynthesis